MLISRPVVFRLQLLHYNNYLPLGPSHVLLTCRDSTSFGSFRTSRSSIVTSKLIGLSPCIWTQG